MITLHHFVHPQWFEEMGAFEKEENIEIFVAFCKKVFAYLGTKVLLWNVINEPTIYVFHGYLPFRTKFPPGKKSWSLATRVLKNLLQAHVEVYRALKAMPGGNEVQIGFCHQHIQFEPVSWWNPIERMPGYLLNTFMGDAVIDFLRTGTFTYGWKGWFKETYTVKEPIADFIALNYYSKFRIQQKGMRLESVPYPGQVLTDMEFSGLL